MPRGCWKYLKALVSKFRPPTARTGTHFVARGVLPRGRYPYPLLSVAFSFSVACPFSLSISCMASCSYNFRSRSRSRVIVLVIVLSVSCSVSFSLSLSSPSSHHPHPCPSSIVITPLMPSSSLYHCSMHLAFVYRFAAIVIVLLIDAKFLIIIIVALLNKNHGARWWGNTKRAPQGLRTSTTMITMVHTECDNPPRCCAMIFTTVLLYSRATMSS